MTLFGKNNLSMLFCVALGLLIQPPAMAVDQMNPLKNGERPAYHTVSRGGVRPEMSTDFQDILKLVNHLNLKQADKASEQTFEHFFQQKSTMNEPVRMLEKATATKQQTNTKAAPPRRAHRSF